jgi:hypothetical protein
VLVVVDRITVFAGTLAPRAGIARTISTSAARKYTAVRTWLFIGILLIIPPRRRKLPFVLLTSLIERRIYPTTNPPAGGCNVESR